VSKVTDICASLTKSYQNVVGVRVFLDSRCRIPATCQNQSLCYV